MQLVPQALASTLWGIDVREIGPGSGWLKVGTGLTFLEFFPILVSVWVWGDEMANHTVHFWCDNMAVVHRSSM